MNLIFVMYPPGAKGKFITELVDLSLSNEYLIENFKSHAGNVTWNYLLRSNNYFNEYPNGVFPEEENYKEYIYQIEETCKTLGYDSLCIDTHYQNEETVAFLLERNHRVIRITTTVDDSKDLQNNFFYKNFIYSITADNSEFRIMDSLQIAKTSLTSNKLEELKTDLTTPLHLWSKEKLTSLFDAVSEFTSGKMVSIESRKNLLNLKYSDLNDMNTLLQLPQFLGVDVNDNFLSRSNAYLEQQKHITDFDEYIDKFITQ